jgi:predicted dehydrogenase
MDLSQERRTEAVARFGCQAYDDYAALIADTRVEAVVVATPNFLHANHVVTALEAGKHVVCEKPFGLHAGEADAMIAAAQQAGKLVAPFQNRRYEPHFLKVKENHRKRNFGRDSVDSHCVARL